MRNETRYFAVILHKGGKLQRIWFYSHKERKEYCAIYENHARPITIAQWKKIPDDMKYNPYRNA